MAMVSVVRDGWKGQIRATDPRDPYGLLVVLTYLAASKLKKIAASNFVVCINAVRILFMQ